MNNAKLFTLQGDKNFSVLLVSPNDSGSYRSATFVTENLGIGYLSAYLSSRGVSVTICDARAFSLSPQEAASLVGNVKFDLIGLSIATRRGAHWCKEFLVELKNTADNVHITSGGQFPTLETNDTFSIIDRLDSVIMGEGEISLAKLCDNIQNRKDWTQEKGISFRQPGGEVFVAKDRDIETCLDNLPFPYRYLADTQDEFYEVLIEGSRGCVFWCSFCAIRPFLGKTVVPSWRIRSARSIVDEIKQIKERNSKLQNFRFVDSDFIGPVHNERAWEFAKLAQEELGGVFMHMEGRAISIMNNRDLLKELKKAGLRRVYLGVESGSQRILDKMNKQTTVQQNKDAVDVLKELDIDFSYGFIMFTPWSLDEDVAENIKMLKYIGKIQMNKFFHELFLIKGTVAYQMTKLNAVLDPNNGYYTYPNLSENITKLRKLGAHLEYQEIPFMKRLWLLYNKMRKLNFANAHSIGLEHELDELYIKIFEHCWELIKNTKYDEKQIVADCIFKFDKTITNLENKINKAGEKAC